MEQQDFIPLSEKRIRAILEEAWLCSLAMSDGCTPYVLPICCRIRRSGDRYCATLYSEPSGRKMRILRRNPNAALLIRNGGREWMESVTAYGTVSIAELHYKDYPGYPVKLEIMLSNVSGRMFKRKEREKEKEPPCPKCGSK